MEYITFMHNNVDTPATDEQWAAFISLARDSGLFRGGSQIANRTSLGEKEVPDVTEKIGGYMIFDCDNLDALKDLLAKNPVAMNGGTVEICELPKT